MSIIIIFPCNLFSCFRYSSHHLSLFFSAISFGVIDILVIFFLLHLSLSMTNEYHGNEYYKEWVWDMGIIFKVIKWVSY